LPEVTTGHRSSVLSIFTLPIFSPSVAWVNYVYLFLRARSIIHWHETITFPTGGVRDFYQGFEYCRAGSRGANSIPGA
jgi:hypothetical protein